MAFTDMLRNNSPQAATGGGTGYGNQFLGTFANLAYGSPEPQAGTQTKIIPGGNAQAGGQLSPTDPNYPVGGYDALGRPINQTTTSIKQLNTGGWW